MNKKSTGLTALIRAFNTESLNLPPVIRACYPELRLFSDWLLGECLGGRPIEVSHISIKAQ
jgi:hypothetical protein